MTYSFLNAMFSATYNHMLFFYKSRAGESGLFPAIISAAFSAIIIVGALVLPDEMVGIIDASTTRRPSIP